MTKETFKKAYLESVTQYCAAPLAECSAEQKYKALVRLVTRKTSAVRAETVRRRNESGQKRVYYFSMEFLIGRLLKNYLINLGWDETVEEGLRELGVDLDELCECERDPGLGNGGLGRLAACFMDSMASLDIPCTGIGIRYRFGLFRQRIRDGRIRTIPWWCPLAGMWSAWRKTVRFALCTGTGPAFWPFPTMCPCWATAARP